MKDKIIGIGLAIVLASGIYLSVFGAGEGASQKWTNRQIVDATTNLEARVDVKMETLRKQLEATMAQVNSILSNTNNTNAVAEAISVMSVSTAPVASTLINKAVNIEY